MQQYYEDYADIEKAEGVRTRDDYTGTTSEGEIWKRGGECMKLKGECADYSFDACWDGVKGQVWKHEMTTCPNPQCRRQVIFFEFLNILHFIFYALQKFVR